MGHSIDGLQRMGLKLFLGDTARVDPHEVVPVLHRWIQTSAIDQLLIDVADYTHLHEGPSVVLIAHEGNFVLDQGGGRMGLQYFRKQPVEGPLAVRLTSLCRTLVKAAALLEAEPALNGRARFRTDELELVANDRLLAPNTTDAFEALRRSLRPLLDRLYPGVECRTSRVVDPKERLTIAIAAASPPTLAALSERLR